MTALLPKAGKCRHGRDTCFMCDPPPSKEREVAARASKAPNLTCFLDMFPLALAAVAEVHDYERGPLVKGDYRPSLLRHLFGFDEHADVLTRKKKVAWNALADLEIAMREERGR